MQLPGSKCASGWGQVVIGCHGATYLFCLLTSCCRVCLLSSGHRNVRDLQAAKRLQTRPKFAPAVLHLLDKQLKAACNW